MPQRQWAARAGSLRSMIERYPFAIRLCAMTSGALRKSLA
jgi:hypothetical protein